MVDVFEDAAASALRRGVTCCNTTNEKFPLLVFLCPPDGYGGRFAGRESPEVRRWLIQHTLLAIPSHGKLSPVHTTVVHTVDNEFAALLFNPCIGSYHIRPWDHAKVAFFGDRR